MNSSSNDTDDPLQAALAEAESLMESLGGTDGGTGTSDLFIDDNVFDTAGVVVGTNETGSSGFAIDSDEEDEDGAVLLNRLDNQKQQAQQTQAQAQAQSSSSVPFHPLADNFLSNNNSRASNSNSTNAVFHPLQQAQQSSQQRQYPLPPPPPPTTPSIDMIKASTSRLAFGLASMAQRATNAAVTVTTGVPVVAQVPPTGPTQPPPPPAAPLSGGATGLGIGGYAQQQQQQQQLQQQQQQRSISQQSPPLPPPPATQQAHTSLSLQPPPNGNLSTPIASVSSTLFNYANSAFGLANAGSDVTQGGFYGAPAGVPSSPGMIQQQQQQQQSFAQQPQQQQAYSTVSSGGNIGITRPIELDKETRETLVREHVGSLLHGEQIIYFLTNLLQVHDSCNSISSTSSTSFNNTTSNSSSRSSDFGWCCAMTCYRLLLFYTGTGAIDDGETVPSGWNPLCWPMKAIEKVIQISLASIEKIERYTVTSSSIMSGSTSGANSLMLGPSGLSSGSINATGNTNSVANAGNSLIIGLTIYSKLSGRQIKVAVSTNYQETIKFHDKLSYYAFPGRRNIGYLFAFESQKEIVLQSLMMDPATGKEIITIPPYPKRFDPIIEYQRQFNGGGAPLSSSSSTATTAASNRPQPWVLWTNINGNYQLCGTYPNVIVGPASLNPDPNNPTAVGEAIRTIRQCAAFRSEQRLPSLTWTMPDRSGGSLWRCSQPKIGLQGNRSSSDELFFKHILDCSIKANSYSNQQQQAQYPYQQQHQQQQPVFQIPAVSRHVLVQLTGSYDLSNWVINDRQSCGIKILDLRPRSSAMANRTGGYGYENTSNYTSTTLQFCNIGNIHAIRDSYQKLCNVCNSYNPSYDMNWNNTIEDTKWLYHIRLILAASWEAAYWTYIYRIPVIVHCSHGWDRTSQVVALAQILLDPYYRTCAGLACLIEKDFMSFGHPFHIRCGHGEGIGPAGISTTGSTNTTGNSSGGSNANNPQSNPNIGSSNPLFNTIQQHTGGLITNAFGAATSGSNAASPGSGGGPNTGGSSANGSGGSSFDEGQISPIFLQFLDCLYQIVNLYSDAFEYNTKYIYILSEHIYSCRFGNFLCDSEKEREKNGIRQRTGSIWDYLESRPDVYNRKYDAIITSGGNNITEGVLLMPLPILLRNVRLWTDRHCRNSPKPTVRTTAPTSYDNEWYVTNATIQTKFLQQEQTPLITQQEQLRMILSSSSVATISATATTTAFTNTPTKSNSNPQQQYESETVATSTPEKDTAQSTTIPTDTVSSSASLLPGDTASTIQPPVDNTSKLLSDLVQSTTLDGSADPVPN